MRSKFLQIVISILLVSTLLSCSAPSVFDKTYPELNDNKYDSGFPYRSSSKQLEEISNTIKLVNSIAFYKSYVMGDSSKKYTRPEIANLDLRKTAVEEILFTNTAAGTGTIIYSDSRKVAVLTVAHIVDFPDTVYSYFLKPDGSETKYVESVSIKTRQSNYIPDFPEGGELDILEMDETDDLAILGKKFSSDISLPFPVFKYKLGKSEDLEWGTFVYILGYPLNYKMVSEGIVSPGRDPNTFLINTVFNRGYSGGIVLAIRDGVPNFELVGLVKSVPAEYEYSVRPLVKEHNMDFNSRLPYKGEVYVEKEHVFRYGITKVIGAETIERFLNNSKSFLNANGYFIRGIIK